MSIPFSIIGVLLAPFVGIVAVQAKVEPENANGAVEPAPAAFVVVEGQVTDHTGAGQKDVRVVVRRKAEAGGEGALVAEVATDEFGDFAVRTTDPVWGLVVVTIEKEPFAPQAHEFKREEGDDPPFLGVTLRGTLSLTGMVTGAPGDKPLAGAAVLLRAGYQDSRAVSDEDGSFRLGGLSPGGGELIVEAEGFGRERVEIKSVAEAGEIAIRLKPQRVLRLRVVSDAGTPVAGAIVEVLDEARQDFRSLVSDGEGRAEVKGVHFDADRLRARLTHPEFVSSVGFDRALRTPEDRAESVHELVMMRAGRVAGRIVDGAGNGLHGARVATGEVEDTASPRDWSDSEGRFSIGGVGPGRAVVTVHLADYAPALHVAEVSAGQKAEVNIELAPGAVLAGVVETESGEPGRGVEVVTGEWQGYRTLGLRAMTDHEGRFTMFNVPRDEFEIRWLRGRSAGEPVQVRGGTGDAVRLVLPERAVADESPWEPLKPGGAAPEFTLRLLDGSTVRSSELAGKVVLVDFWATWCPPCVAEMPELVRVHEAFGARDDFVMIGVSLDTEEREVREFVQRRGVEWMQAVGEGGGAPAAADAFGVRGIPALFLIDREGKIAGAYLRAGEVKGALRGLFAEQSSP